MALRTEGLGAGHPDVARDLNALGALYHLAGRFDDAARAYGRALAVFEDRYGPDHFEVAMTCANLAVLAGDQGRGQEAESLGRRSLRILEAILGPEDAEVGLTLLNLAEAVAEQGRQAEAAGMATRAAAILEARLPAITRMWRRPPTLLNAWGPVMTDDRRPGGPSGGFLPVLPRAAWVVLGGDFVSAIGSGLTLPCLFIYAYQVRDLSYGTAGLVVSTIALASLVGNPVGGAAADRWTPRRTLMAGLVVAAAGSVLLALARTTPALFGAAGLLGLGVSVIWPAQDALLASLAGPADRSAVFSVRHACLNAGLGLGALGAAAVVSVAHPGTFVAVYVADAVSFLAFVPVLARLGPTRRPRQASTRARPGKSAPASGRYCGTRHSCGSGR